MWHRFTLANSQKLNITSSRPPIWDGKYATLADAPPAISLDDTDLIYKLPSYYNFAMVSSRVFCLLNGTTYVNLQGHSLFLDSELRSDGGFYFGACFDASSKPILRPVV